MGCCSSKEAVEETTNVPTPVVDDSTIENQQSFIKGTLDAEEGCSIEYTINKPDVLSLPPVKAGIASITCKTGAMKVIYDKNEYILKANDSIFDIPTSDLKIQTTGSESCSFCYNGYEVKKDDIVTENKVEGFVNQEEIRLQAEKRIIDQKDDVSFKGVEQSDKHLLLLLLNDLKSSINLVDFIFPLNEQFLNVDKYIGDNKQAYCFLVYFQKNPCGIATIIHNAEDKHVLEISYMISSNIKDITIGKQVLLLILHYIKKNIPCKSMGVKVYSRNRLTVNLLLSYGFVFNNSIDNPSDLLRGNIDCYMLQYDKLDSILADY